MYQKKLSNRYDTGHCSVNEAESSNISTNDFIVNAV